MSVKIYMHRIQKLVWTSRKRNHYSTINGNLVKSGCNAPETKFITSYLF